MIRYIFCSINALTFRNLNKGRLIINFEPKEINLLTFNSVFHFIMKTPYKTEKGPIETQKD